MARRDYANAVRWLRTTRPRHIRLGALSMRCFGGSFLAGTFVIGLIAFVSPGSFGVPGRRVLSSGVWTWALIGAVAVAALGLLANRRRVTWLYRRIREPYRRPFAGEDAFEEASNALAQCPDAMQTRWAVSWIYLPTALAVAGVTFAFSTAYFVISAILSGGRISWMEPTLAGINAALSLAAWSLGAVRLSTWRLAVAVHREVTGRYLG